MRLRGQRAAMPLPRARPAAWRGSLRRSASAQGLCADGLPAFVARTVGARARCRGGVTATTGFGAGDAFRHLSSSPTHGDRDPGRPARQGLRQFVRSFARSLRAAASAAPWRSGLAAGLHGAPRATNSGNTAANGKHPLNAKPGRQNEGARNLGTRSAN